MRRSGRPSAFFYPNLFPVVVVKGSLSPAHLIVLYPQIILYSSSHLANACFYSVRFSSVFNLIILVCSLKNPINDLSTSVRLQQVSQTVAVL